MSELVWLDEDLPVFPDTSLALTEPDGLLAAGGNLHSKTLIDAYTKGIFPWFTSVEPYLWWTPSSRAVLLPGSLNISKGSRKQIRKLSLRISTDKAFDDVIRNCALQRQESGTWITEEIVRAYINLFKLGFAHSVEVWGEDALIGGLYGVKLGSVFCGESMFNLKDNAAKYAFYALASGLFGLGYKMIDCQIPNDFLASLGVTEIPRVEFENRLRLAQTENLEWPSIWPELVV